MGIFSRFKPKLKAIGGQQDGGIELDESSVKEIRGTEGVFSEKVSVAEVHADEFEEPKTEQGVGADDVVWDSNHPDMEYHDSQYNNEHFNENREDDETEEAVAKNEDSLPTVVYLTDDGDSMADTRSLISDGMSESDVVSGFTELSKVLAAMELEEAQRGQSVDTINSEAVLGTTPDGDVSTASIDTHDFSRNLVKLYNDLAVRLMESRGLDQALTMLQKAEAVLEKDSWRESSVTDGGDSVESGSMDRSRLKSITYNNLGCLYRRMSMPTQALDYLNRALTIEQQSGSVQDCASTYLNLSATNSVLGNYRDAITNGERAIVLLQGSLWGARKSFQEGLAQLSLQLHALNSAKEDAESIRMRQKIVSNANVLAMAYHNIAVEHERLGQNREAHVSFTRACSIGNKILGSKSTVTITLMKAHKRFQSKSKEMQVGTKSSHTSNIRHPNARSTASLKVRQTDTGGPRIPLSNSRSSLATSKAKKSRGTLPFS